MFKKVLAVFSRRRRTVVRTAIILQDRPEVLTIRHSTIHSLGSFAKKEIEQGAHIRMMSGDVIDFKEVMSRINRGSLTPDDPLQIDTNLFIDLDPSSLAINHSCSPNAGIRSQNELIAIRNIGAGEEVTFDYSTTVSRSVSPEAWSMKCKCKSKHCRLIIQSVKSISKERLLKYQRANALPDYIVSELSGILED